MSNELYVGLWSIRQAQAAARAAADKPKKKKKPLAKYTKPPELLEFEREYTARHYANVPNIPPECRTPFRFEDRTANGLTKAIISHLQMNGHFAARVNTTGVYDARRGQYRCTNARKGMADISAVINGTPVQIEVKAGRDKARTDQLQVQSEYQAAGGFYIFVHTFPEYLEQYQHIKCEHTERKASAGVCGTE